ncbi:MAG: asparagine synthase (glutamine-hydrolyzing) [Deltaproteobacteria bacterium]|nr:asparagine synthase (glutamine-hydrolyzing) [Deltaproteobacteria bacterium]
MCGITGYAGLDDPSLLRKMCGVIVHRGPDEDGFYAGDGVGLAMRRLAVIDLETGSQPIANEKRDVWVVFNGEIYNFEELRKTLEASGHAFATNSDTETIVHLYEDHGPDFVDFLQGMFAIALWDERRGRLLLARDRIGEKPLYYAFDEGKLFFGSEIKAILQAGMRRAVDAQSVCDFLAAGYVAGERTFFKGISKILPGNIGIYEKGDFTVRPYWNLEIRHEGEASYRDSAETLSRMLEDTVRLCLKSDVEVGAFLSGGIDSSVLVALMRRNAARVKTFTVGYGGAAEGFNELKYASRVARLLGTEHHELILGPTSSIDLLPKIIWQYDEPHGEPTSVLVYLLSRFTKEKVKVAVGGTGGDEIFFGYPRHGGFRMLEMYHRVPRVFRRRFIEEAIRSLPESTRGNRFAKRAKRFLQGAGQSPESAYLAWVCLLQEDVRRALLSESVRGEARDIGGDGFLKSRLREGIPGSPLDKAASLDIRGYLPEYQLRYMDRMSMAHGLEVRSPLCDYRLVEYVTNLPVDYRLKGTRSKRIFKDVARRWLPAEITERRKVGFDSPVGQWFKGELKAFLLSFLSKENVRRSGLLDPDAVTALIGEHLSGRRDYSLQLWSLLALETWFRMYIEDGVVDAGDYRLADLRGAGTGVPCTL